METEEEQRRRREGGWEKKKEQERVVFVLCRFVLHLPKTFFFFFPFYV